MPGSIQSIERASSVLHLLGVSPAPVALGDLARMLGLAKPTVHGIVRTLCDVGFVAQDSESGRYHLGDGIAQLTEPLDPHLLRSRASNWAVGVGARSGGQTRKRVCGISSQRRPTGFMADTPGFPGPGTSG